MSEEEGSCSHVKDDLKWGVGEGNKLEFLTSMSAVLSRSVCAFESMAKFDRKNKPFKHTSVKRNVKPLPIACSGHTIHCKSNSITKIMHVVQPESLQKLVNSS